MFVSNFTFFSFNSSSLYIDLVEACKKVETCVATSISSNLFI